MAGDTPASSQNEAHWQPPVDDILLAPRAAEAGRSEIRAVDRHPGVALNRLNVPIGAISDRGDDWGEENESSTPDLVAVQFSEPERTIRPSCDTDRFAVCCGYRVLAEFPCHCDSPDLVAVLLGKPQRSIRSRSDARGPGVARCGVLCDDSARRNSTDSVTCVFREPERAIRSSRDAVGITVGRQKELGD